MKTECEILVLTIIRIIVTSKFHPHTFLSWLCYVSCKMFTINSIKSTNKVPTSLLPSASRSALSPANLSLSASSGGEGSLLYRTVLFLSPSEFPFPPHLVLASFLTSFLTSEPPCP